MTLKIPLSSYVKIMGYAKLCDQEISGFADVRYDRESQAFVVGEVYLLDQTVGPAHTEMTEEAISEMNLKFIEMGRSQLPRLWWHSHVNMEAFFSGADEATIQKLANETFGVALVVNKRQEYLARLTAYPSGIIIDNLTIQVTLDNEFPGNGPMEYEISQKVRLTPTEEPKIVIPPDELKKLPN